jgi:hypothetical protein
MKKSLKYITLIKKKQLTALISNNNIFVYFQTISKSLLLINRFKHL